VREGSGVWKVQKIRESTFRQFESIVMAFRSQGSQTERRKPTIKAKIRIYIQNVRKKTISQFKPSKLVKSKLESLAFLDMADTKTF
jgi:hypothetical protein